MSEELALHEIEGAVSYVTLNRVMGCLWTS